MRVLPAVPNVRNPFLNDDDEVVDDADIKNDNIKAIIAFNNNIQNNNNFNHNQRNGAHMVHTQKFTGTNFPSTTTTNTSLSHRASPAKPPRPGPPARPPPPSSSIGHSEFASNATFTADFAHANIPPPKPLPPVIAGGGNQTATTVKSAFDDLEDTMRVALGSPSKGGVSVGGPSMFVSSNVGFVEGGAQQAFHHNNHQQQTTTQQQQFSSNNLQQSFVGGLLSRSYFYSHSFTHSLSFFVFFFLNNISFLCNCNCCAILLLFFMKNEPFQVRK